MDIVIVVATVLSGTIFFSVVELIRRDKLKEKYSLLWLASSIVILIFSVSRQTLHAIALFIGIYYPPSLIFILAFLFLIVINAAMLSLVALLLNGFQISSFWTAIGASLVVSVTSWVASGLIGNSGKIEVIRRR